MMEKQEQAALLIAHPRRFLQTHLIKTRQGKGKKVFSNFSSADLGGLRQQRQSLIRATSRAPKPALRHEERRTLCGSFVGKTHCDLLFSSRNLARRAEQTNPKSKADVAWSGKFIKSIDAGVLSRGPFHPSPVG